MGLKRLPQLIRKPDKAGHLKQMEHWGAHHKAKGGEIHEEVNRPPPWKKQSRAAWDRGFSKSFNKLNPKLLKADKAFQSRPRENGGWTKENYVQWRSAAGTPGSRSRADRLGDKEGARAMVTGAGNQSKRAGRKLP